MIQHLPVDIITFLNNKKKPRKVSNVITRYWEDIKQMSLLYAITTRLCCIAAFSVRYAEASHWKCVCMAV